MQAAIVVGVGPYPGLGAALARRFAAGGMHVFLGARSEAKLQQVSREIEERGGAATPVPMDTTASADVQRLFDVAERECGAPRLVAYNAGNNRALPLTEMSDAFFEKLWRLCCFGGFLVGREAAKRMQAEGGTLLFTGATASLRARPPFTAFASAKAALRALAHGMAREFGPQGIHVAHIVIDGAIRGDALLSRFPQVAERLGPEGMLEVDAIADAFWMLHRQPRSAWSLELDLRPHCEKF